ESALAVRSSLPLLRKAARVTVIDGSRDEDTGTCALPDTDICGWLDTHGVKAEVRRLDEASLSSPGPALLDIAHREGADLIVMGAWGRSRLSEMVLGVPGRGSPGYRPHRRDERGDRPQRRRPARRHAADGGADRYRTAYRTGDSPGGPPTGAQGGASAADRPETVARGAPRRGASRGDPAPARRAPAGDTH
ncbi:hypothetical protein KCV01_g25590, partial [Aureobasidium melanogenum]